jgi:hypothetical protein
LDALSQFLAEPALFSYPALVSGPGELEVEVEVAALL